MKLRIKDFRGLFTDGDLPDLAEGSFLETSENTYTRHGKIFKRPPREVTLTHPTGQIRSLFRFIDSNLTGGALWVALVVYNDGNSSDIEIYNTTSGEWEPMSTYVRGEGRRIGRAMSIIDLTATVYVPGVKTAGPDPNSLDLTSILYDAHLVIDAVNYINAKDRVDSTGTVYESDLKITSAWAEDINKIVGTVYTPVLNFATAPDSVESTLTIYNISIETGSDVFIMTERVDSTMTIYTPTIATGSDPEPDTVNGNFRLYGQKVDIT